MKSHQARRLKTGSSAMPRVAVCSESLKLGGSGAVISRVIGQLHQPPINHLTDDRIMVLPSPRLKNSDTKALNTTARLANAKLIIEITGSEDGVGVIGSEGGGKSAHKSSLASSGAGKPIAG